MIRKSLGNSLLLLKRLYKFTQLHAEKLLNLYLQFREKVDRLVIKIFLPSISPLHSKIKKTRSTEGLYSPHFKANHFPENLQITPGTEGLVAVGGALSTDILIECYSVGIFPWYETFPIKWYSPPLRMVLFPNRLHINKNLAKKIRQEKNKGELEIKVDHSFEKVIVACKKIYRKGQTGTWITRDMLLAFLELHKKGIAHSFEVWRKDMLIGGLYGVSLGKAFFGESMFSYEKGASKFALIALCNLMQHWDYHYIDCQVPSEYLMSMGADPIDRPDFLKLLQRSNRHSTKKYSWDKSGLVTSKIFS